MADVILFPDDDEPSKIRRVRNAVLPLDLTEVAEGGYTAYWANGAAVTVAGRVLPILVSPPALVGAGLIGQPMTVVPGIWNNSPSFVFQWLRGTLEIAGATGATYTPVPADDLADLTCRVTATTADGTLQATASARRITYPAPSRVGEPVDEVFDQGSGVQTFPIAQYFSGENLSFRIEGRNATIDAVTGIVSILTDVPMSGEVITFSAMNSGGTAVAQIMVTVEAEVSSSVRDLTITATRTSGIAPFGVRFEAAPVGYVGNAFHDVYYQWDFGEPGAIFINREPAAHYDNNANEARGPLVCHTFTQPGTRTVTCTGRTRDGVVYRGTFQINVIDQATVAWNRNFVVSFAGNFDGAPAGATQITTQAALNSAISGGSGQANQRFLFRRGETFNLTGGLSSFNGSAIRVGAFGVGSTPRFLKAPGASWGQFTNSFGSDVTLYELHVHNPFNMQTGANFPTAGSAFGLNGPNMTVHRCTAFGFDVGVFADVSSSGTTAPGAVFASDCDVSGWGAYGFFGQLSIYGGRVWLPPTGVAAMASAAAPYRGSIANLAYYGKQSFIVTGHITSQPTIRLDKYAETFVHRINVDRIYSNYRCRISGQQHVEIQAGGVAVVDGCFHRLRTDVGSHAFEWALGGVHFRNNVVVNPAGGSTGHPSYFEASSASGSINPAFISPPTRIYNNTCINLASSGARAVLWGTTGGARDIAESNNITYGTGSAGLSTLDAANLYRPRAGSPVLGAATGLRAVGDIAGNIRGASTAVGAWDGAT